MMILGIRYFVEHEMGKNTVILTAKKWTAIEHQQEKT
jgi:hypothetical protein